MEVYQYTANGGKRLIGKVPEACGSKGGKERRLQQLNDLVEEAATRPRPAGESPRRGFGVHIEGSTSANRQNAAGHFSPDGRAVNHGSHSHPNAGPYSDPNFQHQGSRGHFYSVAGGAILLLLTPHANELVELKTKYPTCDISFGDVAGAGALDLLQVVDPGISDLIEHSMTNPPAPGLPRPPIVPNPSREFRTRLD